MHVIVQPFYFMQQKHFEDAFTALIPQHFDTVRCFPFGYYQIAKVRSKFSIYYLLYRKRLHKIYQQLDF